MKKSICLLCPIWIVLAFTLTAYGQGHPHNPLRGRSNINTPPPALQAPVPAGRVDWPPANDWQPIPTQLPSPLSVPSHAGTNNNFFQERQAPDEHFVFPETERSKIRFGLDQGMIESVLMRDEQLKQMLNARREQIGDPNIRLVDWWDKDETFFQVWNQMKQEQENDDQDRPDSAKLSANIKSELRKVNSDTQTDEIAKAHHINVLETAQENMAKFKDYQQTITRYQAEIDAYDKTLDNVKQQLADFESLPAPAINPNRSIEQLQREIENVQHKVDLKNSELLADRNESKRINQRIADVPKLKAAAQQRLKEVTARIAVAPTSDDGSDLLQQAIHTATESEIKMLGLETRHLELDSQLNPLQIDLASRELDRLESTVQELKLAANRIRNREVQEQIALAQQAVTDAHPRMSELAQRNQTLAELRKEVAEQIQDISIEKSLVAGQSKKVETDLASIRKQIEESISTAKNLLLVETSRQMISPVESRVRLSKIKSQMQTLNTSLFQLQEERQQLADPKAWLESQMAWDDIETSPDLMSMAIEFVGTRKSLMDSLLTDYRSLIRLLGETAAQREKLIAGLEETREFLGENMLWVQSTSPVSLQTLKTSSDGVQSFFNKEAWTELVNKMSSRLVNRPQETLIYTMVFAGLFFIVKRLGG